MKKLTLALAIVFMLSFGITAHAQESWNEGGLSNSICRWIRVQMQFAQDEKGVHREVWKKCTEQDTNCTDKFCSGEPSSDTAQGLENYWEKENCNKYCITLQEQLPIEGHKVRSISGDSGVDLLSSYFGMWYKFGALVLGLIAVLVIVISGVQISMGGASEEGVSAAKTRMMAAILSVILLFSSALILHTINPLFFT